MFCRFSGCNLWSGRESDRLSAVCTFCDTDFVGTNGTFGAKYATAHDLAEIIASLWPAGQAHRYVVLTGGEPLLQVDEPLIAALHARGFEIAVETNGTISAPPGIDWICVSPKGTAPLAQLRGDELKLVYPQPGLRPEQFEALDFAHFLLQPMDGAGKLANTKAAIDYCQARPRWRLSVQTHKVLEIR